MKYIKVIGLAAIAILAMMAVVAASASANAKVCSTSGVGPACGAGHGNEYTGTVEASLTPGKSATLTATNSSGSSVSTVTCTSSVVKGSVTNSSTGTGQITSMTFANCSSAACTKVTASTTASAAVPWHVTMTTTVPGTVNTNGIMDVSKVKGKFVCEGSIFGNVTCEYEAATASAHVKGGEPAEVTATNIPLTRTAGIAFLCGEVGDWSGEYVVTNPKSVFII
jgi:hypothetical protein